MYLKIKPVLIIIQNTLNALSTAYCQLSSFVRAEFETDSYAKWTKPTAYQQNNNNKNTPKPNQLDLWNFSSVLF